MTDSREGSKHYSILTASLNRYTEKGRGVGRTGLCPEPRRSRSLKSLGLPRFPDSPCLPVFDSAQQNYTYRRLNERNRIPVFLHVVSAMGEGGHRASSSLPPKCFQPEYAGHLGQTPSGVQLKNIEHWADDCPARHPPLWIVLWGAVQIFCPDFTRTYNPRVFLWRSFSLGSSAVLTTRVAYASHVQSTLNSQCHSRLHIHRDSLRGFVRSLCVPHRLLEFNHSTRLYSLSCAQTQYYFYEYRSDKLQLRALVRRILHFTLRMLIIPVLRWPFFGWYRHNMSYRVHLSPLHAGHSILHGRFWIYR